MIEKKQAPAIKSYYSNIINSYAIKAIEQYLSSLTHSIHDDLTGNSAASKK